MSAKFDAFENALLDYLFRGVPIPDLGDTLYFALHTADPGEAGNQSTNEVTFTGYARVAIGRNEVDFVLDGTGAHPYNYVVFPWNSGAVYNTPITHWSIGVAASGATMGLYKGALNSEVTSLPPGGIVRIFNGSFVEE